MSAPAINPAPSPVPAGAAGSAGSSAGAQGANAPGTQAHAALTGFEAMLATLYGAQNQAAGETPAVPGATVGAATTGKTAGKPNTVAKTAEDDGKAKAASDTTGAIATATPDPNLALLALSVLTGPTRATPPPAPAANAGASGPPLAAATAANDKSAGQTAGGGLAQLAGGPTVVDADAGKAPTAALPAALPNAATAADSAASNATATAPVMSAPALPNAEASAPQPTPAAPPAPAAAAPPPQPQTPDPSATATAAALQTPPLTGPQATPPQTANPASSRTARVDLTKTTTATPNGAPAAAGTAVASSAKAAQALQPVSDLVLPVAGPADEDSQGSVLDAKADETAPAPTQQADISATASTTTPATLIHAAAVAVRGAPETVANLAAQIVKKLDGRSSQFDVQLDPIGLGKVDVRIAIGADGRMSAAMSFDTPQAAAELKSRSGDLQQAMEQAGFDLSGGMSFDVAGGGAGQGGQTQNQQPDTGAAFRGRAFQAALDTSADAAPPPQLTLRRGQLAGVDIRI
jgi:flagellar hook-length control protein FliK